MAYEDATKYNKVKSMMGYPVGTIVPWSGLEENIPSGWKICSGSFLNITEYPKLFACIGNTYGGTVGSTFRLPDILGKGISDIFRGHYQHLKNASSTYSAGSSNNPMTGLPTGPWSPNPTFTLTNDPYWDQIGESDVGNSGSGSGNPTPSTIDLVGVRNLAVPGLNATVTGLALTEGTLQRAFVVLPRKLGDGHIPIHSHVIDTTSEISHTQSTPFLTTGDNRYDVRIGITFCTTGKSYDNNCKTTNDYKNFTTGDHYVAGGGNIGATRESSGNGFSGGDMLANVGGVKKFHTSISAENRTWTSIGGHNHGSNTINFRSALSVRASNSYSDIISSDVIIDNTPGIDIATINMTSTCPSLTMLFIIKAF